MALARIVCYRNHCLAPGLLHLDENTRQGGIASLAALFAALIYPGLQRRSINKRLHKLQREKFGDTNRFLCEVELTAARIWIRQGDTQISYEWRVVEEIVDTEDAVDIITRDGGGVTVRNRAFQSADERRAFIELAQNLVAQSREVPGSAK